VVQLGGNPFSEGDIIMTGIEQASLFGDMLSVEAETTPAVVWEQDSAKHALDELFTLTCQYKSSKSYSDLLQFVARFRFYSPFNAMLVHVQMAGATYVAPPYRWLHDFGRRIRAGARPLVILRPMGPVMFVFDVSDTEPTDEEKSLPPEVERPFEVRKGHVGDRLAKVIENAKRDGLRITKTDEGSQSAGSVRHVAKDVKGSQKFQTGIDQHRKPLFVDIPIRYDLLINEKLSREAQYATMIHELAHLYCGHLGTPNNRWWPDRRGLSSSVCEFEAESVAYLLCARSNIDNPYEQYLSGYVKAKNDIPAISLE
jgi:hypothetical protein